MRTSRYPLKSTCKVTKFFIALSMVTVSAWGAEKSLRIRDIQQDPSRFKDEVVTVVGLADAFVDSGSATTIFYRLKDDWGDTITIRSSRERPVIGSRYRVTGPVSVAGPELLISEESRIAEVSQTPLGPAQGQEAGQAMPSQPASFLAGLLHGQNTTVLILLGAIVVVLLVLVTLLVLLKRVSKRGLEWTPTPLPGPPGPTTSSVYETGSSPTTGDAPGSVGGDTAELPPTRKVSREIPGGTIKLPSPPGGTFKILPGRLEIVGENLANLPKEIRFYKLPTVGVQEVTFGRTPGPENTHVQIQLKTVSSQQAKMTYSDNRWVLTNQAPGSSNPTRVNGRELGVGESLGLAEGDRIDMGEVSFIFHVS